MVDSDSRSNRHSGEEPSVLLDANLWRGLAESQTIEGFCRHWLRLQCGMLEGVYSGMVVQGPPDQGPFTAAAYWPDQLKEPGNLSKIAEDALKERRGVVLAGAAEVAAANSAPYHIAYPIRIDGKLYGAAALEIAPRPPDQLQVLMRQLQWGIGWLEKKYLQKKIEKNAVILERTSSALDVAAASLQEPHFQQAAMLFATEMAARLGCDRVSVGFLHRRQIKIAALSHSAQFGQKMNLLRCISAAMEESIDQGKTLVYPDPSERSGVILREHEQLARQFDSAAICTIPFLDRSGSGYGAATLERSAAPLFDDSTVLFCETAARLAAPALEEKRKNDRSIFSKIKDACVVQLEKMFGAGHLVRKLAAIFLFALIVFFTFAQGDYRVTADAVIEGLIQRSITAPYNGYIDEANARAGDVVQQDQVLCTLDERDMRLEYLRSISQKEQYLRQYREAMAVGKSAQGKVIQEQINQADAQIELLEKQMARARILAPFDGIVVNGDLSQSLGAPIERGQVLFEMAPLNAYRVILKVDERDIRQIEEGQSGMLVLAAMTKQTWPIVVNHITPVTRVEEGRTFFRVEAGLEKNTEALRPGMEGVSKVLIGRRKLIWIWTHDLIDWVRIWIWTWRP
ncbi:MAG: HlyD family efflux transporter periplasmic adaptor subunit [Candidatus Omnitrophica bacterium]|nr:HlyD family efflux transporter periplasmic adaptor subunit [Candidatus Omnitrophota bacterium]